MPRRYFRRKPTRRRYRRRKTTVAKVKAIVRREIRSAEPVHYIDEYSTGTEVSSTMQFVDLSDAISQGDTVTSRQGDTIRVHKMVGRLALLRDSTATVSPFFARIMLIKWWPDSASDAPNIATEILEDSSNAGQQSPYVLDLAQRKKFKVLKDWSFTLGDADHPALPDSRQFSFSFRLPERLGRVDYNPAANTGKGKFYLLTYANQAPGTEDGTLRYHITQWFDP